MLLVLFFYVFASPQEGQKKPLCVFSVTQVRINRLNQRQRMEQKLKMGHQGPVGLQGKNTLRTFSYREKKNVLSRYSKFLIVPLICSRPPKKNFVEVTELTDITYMSNLVKLRPGHMNIVLVLTDASKNILLSKFAKEVYSFTGWAKHLFKRLGCPPWNCANCKGLLGGWVVFIGVCTVMNANFNLTHHRDGL